MLRFQERLRTRNDAFFRSDSDVEADGCEAQEMELEAAPQELGAAPEVSPLPPLPAVRTWTGMPACFLRPW